MAVAVSDLLAIATAEGWVCRKQYRQDTGSPRERPPPGKGKQAEAGSDSTLTSPCLYSVTPSSRERLPPIQYSLDPGWLLLLL